jgi:hypothetical protein
VLCWHSCHAPATLLQNASNLIMSLLRRCVLEPLAAHVAPPPSEDEGEQKALRPTSTPQEEAVTAALQRAVAQLHWSAGLCMVR